MKIRMLKSKLKRLYIEYCEFCDAAPCGLKVLRNVSYTYMKLVKDMNEILDELYILDPSSKQIKHFE
jgi:hypothetical protein